MAALAYMTTLRLRELLQGIDPAGEMVVRILDDQRLGIGDNPFNLSMTVDFGEEAALPIPDRATSPEPSPPHARTDALPKAGAVAERPDGYELEILGRVLHGDSLKELLSAGLIAIEQLSPGMLEKLATIRPRSKRIVARDPNMLFATKSLVHDYAEPLGNGWWFGTNNSAQETNAWLQRATQCAGLVWGRDSKTNF